jgi:hypothetical protein
MAHTDFCYDSYRELKHPLQAIALLRGERTG